MRALFPRVLLALALSVPGALPQAHAADLDYTGRAPWFSCGEPWATVAERPPSGGLWYLTDPVLPTVNFLVPCTRRAHPIPGTAEWIAYCQARWTSFNPRTGWIETPDGPRRCI